MNDVVWSGGAPGVLVVAIGDVGFETSSGFAGATAPGRYPRTLADAW